MNKARNLKFQAAIFILPLVLLSACGQVPPVMPTPTLTPIVSPTSTVTVIPTNTNTPEPTATEVIKQFKQCLAENYMDCYVDPTDLLDGKYYRWLEKTLTEPFENPPDFAKLAIYGGEEFLYYQGLNGGSFAGPNGYPIHRGVTLGYTKGSWGKFNDFPFIVTPVEFAIPNKPDETKWVVFIMPKGYLSKGWTEATWINLLKGFPKNNAFKISGFDISKADSEFSKESLRKFPDMLDRIAKFRETLDATYISEPGLVLETAILK